MFDKPTSPTPKSLNNQLKINKSYDINKAS